jgi:hypothetical protein
VIGGHFGYYEGGGGFGYGEVFYFYFFVHFLFSLFFSFLFLFYFTASLWGVLLWVGCEGFWFDFHSLAVGLFREGADLQRPDRPLTLPHLGLIKIGLLVLGFILIF